MIALLPFDGYGQEEKSKYKSISKRNLKLDQSVPSLLADAEKIMRRNTKGALDKVEEALALSITQKSIFNEASCYLLLGKINEGIEEPELAIENYKNALQRLEKDYRTTPQYVETLTGLANSYGSLKTYEQAVKYLQLKQQIVNQPDQQAATHLDLAEVYFMLSSFDDSHAHVDSAEMIIDQSGSKPLKIRAQAIAAKIFAQANDVDAAEELYQQSQALDLTIDDSVYRSNEESIEASKEELIDAYKRQDRIEESINLRNQSIASNTIKGRPSKVVKEKQALSKDLMEIGNTSKAILELEDALQLADSIGDNQELANANRALAELWHDAGDYRQSLLYYQQHGKILDKLNDENDLNNSQKEGILKKQQDILSLTKELALDESQYELERASLQLQSNRLRLQQLIIYGLIFLLIAAVIASWLIYRNAKQSRVRGQLLNLKSLRSQMNPHFIFNALNSVNQFISLNDERSANRFLSEFSKLMRLVLDHSQQDFIPLSEEKEILELYLKLEHNRFRDKFEYQFWIAENIALDSIEVPPMLIQPYVENAIWHGLRYKEEKGNLEVKLSLDENDLVVQIVDDGIGREKSQELKTPHQKSHQSTGLKNTQERMSIINKVYNKHYSVEVSDVNGDRSGTKVILTLPQNGKHQNHG